MSKLDKAINTAEEISRTGVKISHNHFFDAKESLKNLGETASKFIDMPALAEFNKLYIVTKLAEIADVAVQCYVVSILRKHNETSAFNAHQYSLLKNYGILNTLSIDAFAMLVTQYNEPHDINAPITLDKHGTHSELISGVLRILGFNLHLPARFFSESNQEFAFLRNVTTFGTKIVELLKVVINMIAKYFNYGPVFDETYSELRHQLSVARADAVRLLTIPSIDFDLDHHNELKVTSHRLNEIAAQMAGVGVDPIVTREVKLLNDFVVTTLKNRAQIAQINSGARPTDLIRITGQPGQGKTLLISPLADAVAEIMGWATPHGKNLYTYSSREFQSPYNGEAVFLLDDPWNTTSDESIATSLEILFSAGNPTVKTLNAAELDRKDLDIPQFKMGIQTDNGNPTFSRVDAKALLRRYTLGTWTLKVQPEFLHLGPSNVSVLNSEKFYASIRDGDPTEVMDRTWSFVEDGYHHTFTSFLSVVIARLRRKAHVYDLSDNLRNKITLSLVDRFKSAPSSPRMPLRDDTPPASVGAQAYLERKSKPKGKEKESIIVLDKHGFFRDIYAKFFPQPSPIVEVREILSDDDLIIPENFFDAPELSVYESFSLTLGKCMKHTRHFLYEAFSDVTLAKIVTSSLVTVGGLAVLSIAAKIFDMICPIKLDLAGYSAGEILRRKLNRIVHFLKADDLVK
jgi:hypothetical protein